MVEYRRFCRPAAGFWNHAVVLSRTNLKCKLDAQAAKLHLIFWEGLTQPVQSPALPLFLRHQNISSVLGVQRGFKIIKLGAPISLLSPTATFATNLHKRVRSVRDLITHFLPWEALHPAKEIIICAVMQERSCPNVIVIAAYTFAACIMREKCHTSSGPVLIFPLHQ